MRKKDKEAKARIPETRVGYFLWQKEIALKKQAAEALVEKYRLAEAEVAKQPKKLKMFHRMSQCLIHRQPALLNI
ncbi:hypothetical protein [methane-oxidizing endosymbiont of Gigantopelta aegis]|uniref:hypothetical protein n=1 Tax=methane-oxidizing endosymbiont of Gigantopelta aegis TaxID=2794938 RepID=UPI0018DBACDE|nr:hypothetical protein [methane-oxidizing endosymbiont of Gigantopelta aegis]